MATRPWSVLVSGKLRIPGLGGAVLWLLVAGTVLRFCTAALNQVTPVSDFSVYHHLATTLALHDDYAQRPGGPAEVYWPPGWPLVLSFAYRIFGNDPTIGELLAAVLSSGTLLVTAILATRLLRRPFAIAAVAILALNPAWIAYTSVLGTEHLAGLLAVSILALVVLRPLTWLVGVAIGLLEALLLLTRADIGFVMLVVLLVAVGIRGFRPHWRFGIATALAVAVGLSPWIARNEAKFGEFVPASANGGRTFYLASFAVNGLGATPPDPPPRYSVYEDPRGFDLYYWRLGFRHVREHPITWMGYNARRLEITWWHETELLFWASISWKPLYSYGGNWIWRIILMLAIFGAIAALIGRVPRRQWLPVVALVISAVVLTTPFVPQPRRHFPVVAPLALLAGLGAQWLYAEAIRARGKLEERRTRRANSSLSPKLSDE